MGWSEGIDEVSSTWSGQEQSPRGNILEVSQEIEVGLSLDREDKTKRTS